MSRPSLHHEARIRGILEANPDAARHGFVTWVRKFWDDLNPRPTECLGCEDEPCSCLAGWLEFRKEWQEDFRFRPDAWAVRKVQGGTEIVCWEVHVYGNPEQKIAAYVNAFWAFDEIGSYFLRLIHVDAFGRQHEVPLMEEWANRLKVTRERGEDE